MASRKSNHEAGRGAGLLAALVLSGLSTAYAGVTAPDCPELKEWIATVDPADRWNPIEGSRAWLPAAFQGQAFLETFGAAPLQWTQAEARATAKHLFACGTKAGEAGDRQARTAFYGARRWFKSNLVGVLVARSRAAVAAQREAEKAARREQIADREQARVAAEQQRRAEQQQREVARMDALQQALDAFVNQPDSLRLLQSLVVLQQTNPRDALAVNSAIGRFGNKAGALLGQARRLGLTMREAPIGPALQERIAQLRAAMVADYARRIDALSAAEPGALRSLTRWEGEIRGTQADALGQQAASDLLARVAQRREQIEDDILAGLIQRIDEAADLPNATDGLARVQESINRGHQAGLSPQRRERLRAHAGEVEARLAERAVVEAEASLAEASADLDGLRRLLNTIPRAERPPLSHAPPAILAAYREAARARLDDVAQTALAEFRQALRALPEDRQGLRALDQSLVSDKAFALIARDVREDYQEAVDRRRDEIRTALRGAAEEQRERAVARGGDPDLVGRVFENQETGLAVGFIDEQRAVVGLNGKEDTAPYEVRGGQVLVYGQGMTLQFRRRGAGPDTTLEWLGKVLTRLER
jgi:hypothetical protein